MYETEKAAAGHIKDVGEYLKKASEEGFETDPQKVKPPKMGRDESGDLVPFEALSPARQAEVMQEHRVRTVARSLAAKNTSYAVMRKIGAPKSLAKALVNASIGKGSATQDEDVFEETLKEGASMTPRRAERLLRNFKDDPKAQAVIGAHLQAGNYLAARQKYLVASSPDRISERDRPEEIFSKLRHATDELRSRSRDIPKEVRSELDPTTIFKVRVLSSLRDLDPEKYKAVKKLADESDAEEYDLKMQKYRQAVKKLDEYAKDPKGYRQKPPSLPEKPTRPSGYWNVREMSDADRKEYEENRDRHREELGLPTERERLRNTPQTSDKSMLDRLLGKWRDRKVNTRRDELESKAKKRRSKQAGSFSSYVGQELTMSLSTCSCGGDCACKAEKVKEAMYHGIKPYEKGSQGFAPYTEWHQAHQRDLSEADQGALTTAARKWLKEPVLANNDWHPDAKFRAALDLAIYSAEGGKYNGAITANLYNKLLAGLTGANAKETLTTLPPKTATMNKDSVKLEDSMKASQEIRTFATKVASENPSLGFDLLALADRVAAAEKVAEDQNKKWMDRAQKGLNEGDKTNKELGREPATISKEAGEMPPQFKENAEKKKEEAEEKKGKEAAYATLKSAVIKAAASDAKAKSLLLPVLQTIKQLG
jgi:hypothetical protein